MSNERFARQYRFEPPSGFLLTSPCTSIVHHLSGPSMHALARHWPRGLARCLPCAVLQARAISISLCVWVCRPNTRTHVRLLGPCFKTGRASPVARHDPGHAASGDAGRGEKGYPRPGRDLEPAEAEAGGGPYGRARNDRAPERGREAPDGKEDWLACFQRFHVLFHFLFKVLFIFPSRYLFAIGLPQIFSFGRTLPPD